MLITVTNITTKDVSTNLGKVAVGTTSTFTVTGPAGEQAAVSLAALAALSYITYAIGPDTTYPAAAQLAAASVISTAGFTGMKPFRASTTLTVAESNAGKTLIADANVGAAAQCFVDSVMITVVGATAWSATASSTKLVVSDTAGSPVELFEVALAALTGNVVLMAPTNVTMKAACVTGGTAGKGFTIRSDGTHDVVAGSTLTITVSGRYI